MDGTIFFIACAAAVIGFGVGYVKGQYDSLKKVRRFVRTIKADQEECARMDCVIQRHAEGGRG